SKAPASYVHSTSLRDEFKRKFPVNCEILSTGIRGLSMVCQWYVVMAIGRILAGISRWVGERGKEKRGDGEACGRKARARGGRATSTVRQPVDGPQQESGRAPAPPTPRTRAFAARAITRASGPTPRAFVPASAPRAHRRPSQ